MLLSRSLRLGPAGRRRGRGRGGRVAAAARCVARRADRAARAASPRRSCRWPAGWVSSSERLTELRQARTQTLRDIDAGGLRHLEARSPRSSCARTSRPTSRTCSTSTCGASRPSWRWASPNATPRWSRRRRRAPPNRRSPTDERDRAAVWRGPGLDRAARRRDRRDALRRLRGRPAGRPGRRAASRSSVRWRCSPRTDGSSAGLAVAQAGSNRAGRAPGGRADERRGLRDRAPRAAARCRSTRRRGGALEALIRAHEHRAHLQEGRADHVAAALRLAPGHGHGARAHGVPGPRAAARSDRKALSDFLGRRRARTLRRGDRRRQALALLRRALAGLRAGPPRDNRSPARCCTPTRRSSSASPAASRSSTRRSRSPRCSGCSAR